MWQHVETCQGPMEVRMSGKDQIGLSMWANPRLDLTSADLHNHAQPLEVVFHVEVDRAGDRHSLPCPGG